MLENKSEDTIIIARNGKPVAKLLPVGNLDTHQRIGIARGLFLAPDNLDADNPSIASLFGIDP